MLARHIEALVFQELYAAAGIAAGGAMFYTANTELVPVSNRSHLVIVSHEKEKELGKRGVLYSVVIGRNN